MEKKTASQAIKDIRVEVGMTHAKLAEKIGANNAQVVQNLVMPGRNMRTDNFIKLANALGYDVILRNRVTDKEILIVKGED